VMPDAPYISTMHPLSGCNLKRAVRVRKEHTHTRRGV
jgi:hypothetical protein